MISCVILMGWAIRLDEKDTSGAQFWRIKTAGHFVPSSGRKVHGTEPPEPGRNVSVL